MSPRKFLSWVFASAITALICLGMVLIVFDLYYGGFPRLAALTSITSPLGQAFAVAIVAAIPATILVFLLQSTRGTLEFSALGIKFRGPSGPLLLWAVIFLVVASVILGALAATNPTPKMLTRLEAETIIQSNRGNIERCVRGFNKTLYLDFVFLERSDSPLNLDVILGTKVAEFGAHPMFLESGITDGREFRSYISDSRKYEGRELTAFITGRSPAYPDVSLAISSGKLSVLSPDVNRCLIETLKSELSVFSGIQPGPTLIHRYITDQGVLASRMHADWIGEILSRAIRGKDFSGAREILKNAVAQRYDLNIVEIEALIEKAETVTSDLKAGIVDENTWEVTIEEVSKKVYELTDNLGS